MPPASSGGLLVPIFGFAVRIQHSFWLIALIAVLDPRLSIGRALEWVAVVGVSILAHELGHAFVASRWAVVLGVDLHVMGGLTRWRPWRPVAWWQALAIALAGPAAGLALGALAWFASPHLAGLAATVARDFAWVGLAWSAFNLLPMPPLDGSHALAAAVERRWPRAAPTALPGVGFATALVVGGAALLAGERWVAMFAALSGIQSFGAFKGRYQERTLSQWQTADTRGAERERY